MLNKKFGQESPLITAQEKVLEYLEININYTVTDKVEISMYKYVRKCLFNCHQK